MTNLKKMAGTLVEIDNRAGRGNKDYEYYTVDREMYPTLADVKEAAADLMNDDVYALRIYVDGEEVVHWLNTVA